MRITQPRIIVFGVVIYYLVDCRLEHVRALCSIDLHMLHLCTARCGRLATASTAPSTAPSCVGTTRLWSHSGGILRV